MRVAWVHPTWRDLVIERLAEDAALRRRFLARCGPHGVVLALSTEGGATGERRLPLIRDDEDWDALGDRIYALAPELDAPEAAIVLTAVDHLLEAALDDATLAGEGVALARMTLERFGELWSAAHTTVALPCIDAWLSAAARLASPPRPAFLAVTWVELVPAQLPDPDNLSEVQRFADWVTLCDLLVTYAPEMLEELGDGVTQRRLRRAYADLAHKAQKRRARLGRSPVPEWRIDEARAQRDAENVIRRVLVDL